MAGKSYIKVGAYDWARIKKMYIKTGGQTWTAIRKAYVKTSTGWKKVYDTASNRPFIRNNDIPKIRLNTFRTDSTYNPTGTIDDPVNPVVEAPPVQKMGPDYTSPSYGWPNEAIGRHLWGYDGDWVSGNGSSMTFVYSWLYNLSGNQNDNILETGVTSTTGRTDMLTNTSAHLGQNDGDYFDRNFLTFRVTATNSAGSASSESTQVYIVRDTPTGSITMIDPDIATPNTTMSATFSYSSSWYNKVDTSESYVEWFAVDNLGDTLTTSNRVQQEMLNTFTVTGTTTKSGTTYHNPQLTNKYYYVRITLNNSNTLPAKYLGSVININGFTPNSAVTATANKNGKTAAANGPFNLTNATKAARFYDSGSSTFKRYVSVDIGQSSSADRYEVQIEGQYSGSLGAYDYTSSSWVVLQTLNAAPYIYESSRIGGTLTMPSVAVTNYLNYRFTARSRNGTSLNGAAYSDNGTSTSYQYVTAPAVAPAAPQISSIATSSDFFGSYITFNNYISSFGSNEWDYYTYSIDNGSNFNSMSGNNGFINNTEGKIYVTPGATINLRIRLTNLDGATSSSSNLLSITAAAVPAPPTSVVVKSFGIQQGTLFFTAGANTQSVQGYLEYDSFSQFDSIQGQVNVSSGNAAKIQLTGANSQTRSYTSYLRPYSGVNLTGGSGTITSYSTKVLNGSDQMLVNVGTPTRPSDRTISLTWTFAQGAQTHYIARLYRYSDGAVISTKTVASTTTSISFTSSDGVQYSTIYYIGIQPQYQYTSSVTYEDANFVSSNINSGANVTAPTSTSIVSMSRLDNSTVRAFIGSSGGSGPYYQLYWQSGSTAPSTTNYDAASTSSTVMEDFSFANGITYYFFIRSSSENLGNTTTGGTATAGTYSDYGPTTGAASYTFASPTGGTASISGSTSVGSTLTLSLGTPSASPAADGLTIIWRRNDGGAGGNSFTGGSIMQNGGTTYVIDSPLIAYSSVGYAIRAEVTWNNGVGSQSANSNSIVVTSSAPGTPTSLSATTTRTDGVNLTFSGSTNATSYDIFWNTTSSSTPSSAATPDFSSVSSPYLDTTISSGATRYYWVRGKNSSGVTSAWYPAVTGVTGTRLTAVTKLSTPTGVSATTTRTDGVNITWNAVSGAAYYGIWWGGVPGYDNAPDFPNITGTSYLDTGISAGSSRTYYVQAYASGNPTGSKSDYSSGATGTRASAPPAGTAPSTPSGLSNSYSSGPSWTGSWSASSGTATITYYWTLYQSASNGGSITATASGSTTGTSFTRAMSSANGLWAYFTVYASNGYGTSGTATSSWA